MKLRNFIEILAVLKKENGVKTIYTFLITIILLLLSSGCANDQFNRAIYEINNSNLIENEPVDIHREKKSYDAYKREREEMLKEGKMTEEQIDAFIKQEMANEGKQAEVNEDNPTSH